MIRGKKAWVIGVMGGMLLILSFCAFAAEEDGNKIDAAPYLREGVGARSMGMGGAATAVASDATAVVWNPAALSKIQCTSIASMYNAKDQLDRRHNFLAIAQSLKQYGTFGIAWINAGVVGLDQYTDKDEHIGTFNSSDNAFMLSYGAFFKPVRLGAGVKVLSEKIDPAKDTQMGFGGFDIGIMAEPVQAVAVGLTVQNLFGTIAGADVPKSLKLGTALTLLPENNLLLSVDLEKAFVNLEGKTDIFRMGAEYWAANLIGFRLGVTSEKEFSAGIGINISNVIMDYAYSIKRNGLEPDSHYFSLSASF